MDCELARFYAAAEFMQSDNFQTYSKLNGKHIPCLYELSDIDKYSHASGNTDPFCNEHPNDNINQHYYHNPYDHQYSIAYSVWGYREIDYRRS